MSVRGSTGSRRLAKQGQTAGHAGEEAESQGSGRGSHQLGTPRPVLLHHKTPQLAVPGKAGRRAARGWSRGGLLGPRMLLTPREQSGSEGSHLEGSARLASGPLAAGGWPSTSWQQAPLTALSSLTTGKGAGVRGVPSRFPMKTILLAPGQLSQLCPTGWHSSLKSWHGATRRPWGWLWRGQQTGTPLHCPEALKHEGCCP